MFYSMTTVQVSQIPSEEKRGGPYTKQEQEERRVKVYELYFEKGYSALKIAETLGVNRNTINSDIKYWYTQITAQIGGQNVGAIVLKEIERLEIQRKRLLEQLEKQTDFASKVALEKMIFEIDSKIAGFASKLAGQNISVDKYGITEEVSEEELAELVRYSIFDADHLHPESIAEETILQDTIKFKKCDIEYARNTLNTMIRLGLQLCRSIGSTYNSYDLFWFASLREYITKDELKAYFKKRQDEEIQEEKRQKEIEEKYEKKYGKDVDMWPDDVEDMMEEELFSGSMEHRYGL